MKHALLLATLAVLSAVSAFGAPAEIVIIRHGEKPAFGNDLSPRGFERAAALVDFFKDNPAVTQNGPAAAIYAMRPSEQDESRRPVQTVTPLAKALGIPIDAKHAREDLSGLAADVMRNPACDGKTAVICWEHQVIPNMVRAFGYDFAPQKWHGRVFDRAWILNFDGQKVVSFKDVPEHLLPGDSVK